jgi:hypothetical protein
MTLPQFPHLPGQQIIGQTTGLFHAYERLSTYEYAEVMLEAARVRLHKLVGESLLEAISDGRQYAITAHKPVIKHIVKHDIGEYEEGMGKKSIPYLYQKVVVVLQDPLEARIGEYAKLVVAHHLAYHTVTMPYFPEPRPLAYPPEPQVEFEMRELMFHRDEIGWKRVA